MALISVIMPVYNVEKYLRQSLESVLGQTLKDIEVVAVNDGSTDLSLAILQEYRERDSRVKVFSQSNQGAGAARNSGLQNANGEYIAFMDPDDFYPDEFVLSDLYTAAINNKVNVVGGSLVEVLPDGKCRQKYPSNDKRSFAHDGFMNYLEYQYDYYYQRFIYSRIFLIKNGISFPNYRRHQDVLFFVRAMIAADKFYALRRCTYCYRINHKQVSWSKEIGGDVISAIKELLEITQGNDLMLLHERIARRLIIQYAEYIFTLLGLEEIRKVLHEALALINFEIRTKKEFNNRIETFQEASAFYRKMESASVAGGVNVLVDKRENSIPKVSVIIPVYNVSKFLGESIGSILQQSLQDIEIICVNDGSTDNSLELLLEYAKNDKRIIVLSQNNKGLSAARNVGVSYARGEYVYFFDSDDKLRQLALEVLFFKASKENLDVLYFDAESFYDNKALESIHSEFKNYYSRNYDYDNVVNGRRLFSEMLRHGDYRTSVCLHFIKRSFYEGEKLYFIPGILHEDNFFAFDCMLKADRVAHVKKQFFLRRVREDSIMTQKKTFAHAYGYYISAWEMLKAVDGYKLTQSDKSQVVKVINSTLNNAVNEFEKLDKSAASVFSSLDALDKEKFTLLVLSRLKQRSNQKLNQDNKYARIRNKFRKVKQSYQDYGIKYTTIKVFKKIKEKLGV